MKTYYQILKVNESADQAEIKAAFKRLAVQYHPDKHSGDAEMEEVFKEINLAYQILSNPYEKARYDIKLTYSRSSPTYDKSYQPPIRHTQTRHSRPRYKEKEINWKENWIATAYAFGFTVIVASLVMTVIWAKNIYEEKKHEELLSSRRSKFENAKADLYQGNIKEALVSLNSLIPHLPEEKDIKLYVEQLYSDYLNRGEASYENQNYTEAVYYLEIIESYSPRKSVSAKELLAMSYKENHQAQLSIKKYKELLLLGLDNLECYTSIGEIYRDQLFNYKEAIRYYELARDKALKQYKSFYGDAYFLVLSERLVPEAHYDIFKDLAALYLKEGENEKAIKVCDWNQQIWPNRVDSYLIAAAAYQNMNIPNELCSNLKKASYLGARVRLPAVCR